MCFNIFPLTVTAPSSSVPSQPESTSFTVTELAAVANHTGPPSTSTPVVFVPILASVLGVVMVMVVGIIIVIIFCKKNPSRGVAGEGAFGKGRKGSTTDRLEKLDQSEGYQPINAAPPIPLATAAAPIGSDASQTIRAGRLGDVKPQDGQHGVVPDIVRPGEASRLPQDPRRPPCIPEDNMNLKNDDELMGHLYCDIDNVQGPSPMLTSTSSPLSDYAEPSGLGGNPKATTLCPAEPGAHYGKLRVAGSLSPMKEDECLHPTYDTKMHVCKIHRTSSVYNEYETKVHKSVPSKD